MFCQIDDAPAIEIATENGESRIVRCANCGEFEIAESCIEKLAKLTLLSRIRVLNKAKRYAKYSERARITDICFIGEHLKFRP